jgi:hypothetical protein
MWENIVMKSLGAMPLWVRIAAFFVALFVSVYLSLIPQFVNGYVYFKDGLGGKRAYRGGEILVSVGGHDYKYIANENGYFSVPMISKLPQSLRLGFVHKDTGGRYDVTVPFTKVTTAAQLDFEVKTDPPSVVFATARLRLELVPRMIAWASGAAAASAGELLLPRGVAPIEKPEAKKVKTEVQGIVGREAKKPLGSLSEKTELTSTNGFPYTVKIRIVEAIEKKYGFRIPDDHWQSFRSVGEVIDYTQKRIALDKVEPSKDITWPAYQNKAQTPSAPLFVK